MSPVSTESSVPDLSTDLNGKELLFQQLADEEFDLGPPSKRPRLEVSTAADQFLPRDVSVVAVSPAPVERRNTGVAISLPPLVFPPSAYEGWESTFAEAGEDEILIHFMESIGFQEQEQYDDQEYLSFDIEDFAFYWPASSRTSLEMVSLHEAGLRQSEPICFFDGVLSNGTTRKFVRRVPVSSISIGALEDLGQHSVGSDLWVQSKRCRDNRKVDIWYRLLKPNTHYSRYHAHFLWLSNFVKYFVDFLSVQSPEELQDVSLHHFAAGASFWKFVNKTHGSDEAYLTWYKEIGRSDFRQVLTCYPDFICSQVLTVNPEYRRCYLWKEVVPGALTAVKPRLNRTQTSTTTSYVFDCFRHMQWANHLSPGVMSPKVKAACKKRCQDFDRRARHKAITSSAKPALQIGDVVAISKDIETKWKGTDVHWYAYIQDIQSSARPGVDHLSVIWLYRPSDTTISMAYYPHSHELFFSNNCNCDMGKIKSTEVISRVKVDFFSNRITPCSSSSSYKEAYFVRQMYNCDTQSFETLRKQHLRCRCRRKTKNKIEQYHEGDTVLVDYSNAQELLQPAEIVSIMPDSFVVRKLLRRHDVDDSKGRPNELVYSHDLCSVKARNVVRKCRVRFFSTATRDAKLIPSPYNKDGTGDCFYICAETVDGPSGERQSRPLKECPRTLCQSFNPKLSTTKLKGLDLFAGGGNLGRGIEEGGAVRNIWAVDWATQAIHSYRLNCKDKKMNFFLGSSNDFLSLAMEGSSQVANVGDIDFIAAGSPCQGYSLANAVKTNDTAMRNCSMLANAASYIDFYRPKYAVLENVVTMANSPSPSTNPLSQLISCFVGMGYQTQLFRLDAWSFGAPQSRSRLFISIAAPGLTLPSHPELTHAHPENVKQGSLGRAANGEPFGERHFQKPVFNFVSAKNATADLPRIDDARVGCIKWPNHMVTRVDTTVQLNRLKMIPKAPYRQGWIQALKADRVGQRQRDDYTSRNSASRRSNEKSRAYKRIHPDMFFPTITTVCRPGCLFTGNVVHWDEDRYFSIMEARRAQGVPDEEVLVGKPAEQYKIVGNSVARQVAVVLGLVIRDAYMEGGKNEMEEEVAVADRTRVAAEAMPEEKSDIDPISESEAELQIVTKSPSASAPIETAAQRPAKKLVKHPTKAQVRGPRKATKVPTASPATNTPRASEIQSLSRAVEMDMGTDSEFDSDNADGDAHSVSADSADELMSYINAFGGKFTA